MIITRLTLKNFGVYAGLNTFTFENKKPVVLIGGMNGRGKTTFLEAVLLALYGANSFAYNESKYHSYGQYLKAYVNKADETLETFVELEFKLEENTQERYLVHREWSGAGKRTREKITVYKDGESNLFLTDNWSMFMENILPSGLSNFFFFDGEKIAELAVESTNAQMKESIKALLGISVLDVLSNDIARITSRISKQSGDQMKTKELDLLREKKNQADVALQIADEHITELTIELENLRKKLEKTRGEYTTKGGDIIAQRQALFNKRNLYTLKLRQSKEQMVNLAAGELPFLFVKELLNKIQVQAQKEHETKIMGFAVDKVNSIFADYTESYSGDLSAIQGFIGYVEEKARTESTEIVFDMADASLYQLNALLKTGLVKAKGQALQTMSDCIKEQEKIDELDSYLSVDIDESALAKLYKKIKILEQKIIDSEVSLEAEQKKRTVLHGDVIRATSEYNHYVEQILSNLELNDDADRILKYSHLASKVLDEYKIRLQERKIGVLAQTMTDCYKKLANKKNLIEQIQMDAVTLDFKYLNADGNEIPKESLSAGEKQLMVISLLWALAICSKKKLPVIIDTPLSRMDSNHRISLITTYFPQASDQTIILSTDSEIDARYYEIMKDNVGDEFTLVYDDNLKCSTIQKGYFGGELYDN